MEYLYRMFLSNETEYSGAERFWRELWNDTPLLSREAAGWQCGWFDAPVIKDGNPIFTAVSYPERKAIRVIQYEATSPELELDFWMDTYGGPITDPKAIRELVIACALSVEAAKLAQKLMSSWVVGDVELSNPFDVAHGFAAIQPSERTSQEFSYEVEFGYFARAA